MMKRLIITLGAFLFCQSLFAELVWESKSERFEKTAADKGVEAHYKFKNTGSEMVKIKSVHSSCGCTTPKLDKKEYAPGEEGEIVAEFKFQGRKGMQRKTVAVIIENKEQEPVLLELIVNIQQPVEVKPTFLFWKKGIPASEKVVDVKASAGGKIHIQDVTSDDPLFLAAIKTVKEGEHYQVVIQPSNTDAPERGKVLIKTDSPDEATYTVNAHVK